LGDVFLLNKDIEFSCDEKVMSILGEEYRADYATTLISLAEENNPFSMTICMDLERQNRKENS
ncbi:hypothetical protein BM531_22000, partial [Clostridioides difficile]